MKTITKIVTMVTLISAGTSTISASDLSGEQLFQANCVSCHATVHPEDESKMAAPAIMGPVNHVRRSHPDREDAIKFMVDYIQNPSKEKAACDKESIDKFGLMPSLKGVVSAEDIEKIANYVYDAFPRGSGKGKGRGKHGSDKMSNGQHDQNCDHDTKKRGEGKGKHARRRGRKGEGHGRGQGKGRK